MTAFKFELIHQSKKSRARVGRIHTRLRRTGQDERNKL